MRRVQPCHDATIRLGFYLLLSQTLCAPNEMYTSGFSTVVRRASVSDFTYWVTIDRAFWTAQALL